MSKSSDGYPAVELLFVGGVGDEVTGSSATLKILTQDGKFRYGMLDCGAYQGEKESLNYEYPVKGEDIEFVLLTHAHFDHIGSLPLLYKQGFRGKVFTTSVVKSIAEPLLKDAAYINMCRAGLDKTTLKSIKQTINRITLERNSAGDKDYKDMRNLDSAIEQLEDINSQLLYSQEDVEETMKLFTTVEPYKYIEVADGVYAKFIPTTHQNGACKIELYVVDSDKTFSMVFSGDVGPSESLLYKTHAEETNEAVDCLVLESLHGVEPPIETLTQSINKLAQILTNAVKRNKNVVLAGFSLDRNAGLIYLLNEFRRAGVDIDLVIDSPLTMTQLAIYQGTYNNGNSKWFRNIGSNPFDTSTFKVIGSNRESKESALHGEAPRVIVTASANGYGGRVVNYFANCIQRDDYVFVFCGWIVPGSPSYNLHEAKRGALVELADGNRYIKKCETIRLHGLSSHGYFEEMVSHLNTYPACSTLILNHAREADKEQVEERILKFFEGDILSPRRLEAYELTCGSARKLTAEETNRAFEQVLVNKIEQESWRIWFKCWRSC